MAARTSSTEETIGSSSSTGAFGRGAQDGPDLRPEQVGPAQRQPDAAPAQEGVGFLADLDIRQALVAADVERADHQRPASERLGDRAIGGELLFFSGRLRAAQEQELGAQHAHALGAVLHGLHGLRRRC